MENSGAGTALFPRGFFVEDLHAPRDGHLNSERPQAQRDWRFHPTRRAGAPGHTAELRQGGCLGTSLPGFTAG